MPRTSPTRARRTKTETQQEFEVIRSQVEQSRESADPKAQELAKLKEAEVRQAVDGITVESVVQRASDLRLDIAKALSQVSEQLVSEVQRLGNVREAVMLETRELERMHKLDVVATTLDNCVRDYQDKRRSLEAEISAQRAQWAEEEERTAREAKETEDALKKMRQREIEDYEYKKSLERKKAQDKYDEEIRLQERKNKEKQETLEKSWQEREAALRSREDELARLKAETGEFPARLKSEVDVAVAEARKAAAQALTQQVSVLKMEASAEKRVADLQIQSLTETLARQAQQIEALTKQLEEAKRQVQDIAVKAIEGASGARALAHVNQIAMEQAKPRGPQS